MKNFVFYVESDMLEATFPQKQPYFNKGALNTFYYKFVGPILFYSIIISAVIFAYALNLVLKPKSIYGNKEEFSKDIFA